MPELFHVECLDSVQAQTPESQRAFQNNLARLMQDKIEFIAWPPEDQDNDDIYDSSYPVPLEGDYWVQYLLPSGTLLEITQNGEWEADRMFDTDGWHQESPYDDDGWWVYSLTTDWTVCITETGLDDNGKPWSIEHRFSYQAQNPGTEEDYHGSDWKVFHKIKASTPEDIERVEKLRQEDLLERIENEGKPEEYDEHGYIEHEEELDSTESASEINEHNEGWFLGADEVGEEVQATREVFYKTCRAMEAHQEAHGLGLTLFSESELDGLNRLLASVDDSMLVKLPVNHHAE